MKIRPYIVVLSEGHYCSLKPIAAVRMPCHLFAVLASDLFRIWAALWLDGLHDVSITPNLDVGVNVRREGWAYLLSVLLMAGSLAALLFVWAMAARGVSS